MKTYYFERGFAPMMLIITLASAVAVSGFGYGVYKYTEVSRENKKLQAELEVKAVQEYVQESATTSTETIPVSEPEVVEEEKPVEKIIEKVYVTPPQQTSAQRQAEIDAAVKKVLEEQAQTPTVSTPTPDPVPAANAQSPFRVVGVAQTPFPDGYGGTYGSYRLTLEVTPGGGDIFIPPTTSDTIGSRIIGFSYTMGGEGFKGVQESEVECSLKNDGYCKFKEGTTREVYVQVFAIPGEDTAGMFSVEFTKIKYYLGDVEKEAYINARSEPINLYY